MNAAPLILLVVVFGLMWLLVVRPQQNRVRAHDQLVAGLQVGDEVVTTGGILGTLVEVDEEVVVLDVGGSVTLRVARGAIGAVLDDQDASGGAHQQEPGDDAGEGTAA
jgi:preprotein translocase subunit YajC